MVRSSEAEANVLVSLGLNTTCKHTASFALSLVDDFDRMDLLVLSLACPCPELVGETDGSIIVERYKQAASL